MSEETTKQVAALVVEDERDYAELLAAVLEGDGYSVEYAVDGVDALEMVRAKRPDVITLDVQMPRKSGVVFYRELKSDPTFADIPVVVVTGIAEDSPDMGKFARTFFELKHLPMPDAYLEKPVDSQDLLRVVGEALRIG